jgi:hypothetical protein
VAPTKRHLNHTLIKSNLGEAIEELARLQNLASERKLSVEDFQVRLCHAYHHLNFAWNIRYLPTIQYRSMTQRQFERWGKYPSEIATL